MIQVYTGDGKGKTTAAFGLAMRAAGHGYRVRIIQFLKGSTYSGELVAAEKLGIEVFQFGRTCPHAAVIKSGFMKCQKCGQCLVGFNDINDWDRQKVGMAWKLAQDTVIAGKHDILVLDEIMEALNIKLIALTDLLAWLRLVPKKMEIILTGRNAPPNLLKQPISFRSEEDKAYLRYRCCSPKGNRILKAAGRSRPLALRLVFCISLRA